MILVISSYPLKIKFGCQPIPLSSGIKIIDNHCVKKTRNGDILEIIHSVGTQNFPKNYHFLPPGTHIYQCVSGGKNSSFSEDIAYVLNE